jgi:hypothetical protein
MSTKTTFKRIALVAVAALGFGMLSAVPSSADASPGALAATSITAGTPSPAGVGSAVRIPVTVGFAANLVNGDTATVAAKVTAAPAGSGHIANTTNKLGAASGDGAQSTGAPLWFGTDGLTTTSAVTTGRTATNGGIFNTAVSALYVANSTAAGTKSMTAYMWFTPDVAGTYTILLSSGVSTAGVGSTTLTSANNDVSTSVTFTTAASAASVTLANVTGAAVSDASAVGSILKATFKDSAGAAATLAADQQITISSNSSTTYLTKITTAASNTAASGTNTTLTFAADDLINGTAWFRAVNQDAATTSVIFTAVGAAGLSTSVTSNLTVAFTATTTAKAITVAKSASATTGIKAGTSTASATVYTVPLTATSVSVVGSYDNSAGTTAVVDSLTITDTNGKITGIKGAIFDRALSIAAAAKTGSTTVTMSFATSGDGFTSSLDNSTGTLKGMNVTSAASSVSASGAAATAITSTVVNTAIGGTSSMSVNVTDQYGVAKASTTVTYTITGRNAAKSGATSLVTDADGNATLSLVDAGTNGASDSVSITAGGTAATFTINYGTFTVGTVTVTGGNTTASVANATVTTNPIAAGDGTEAGAITLTATVKDANGNLLGGVPVTFSVAGTGVAITSNTLSVTSASDGTAAASLYAWIEGTYTYTVTAGAKTTTGTATFGSITATNARVLSATVNGNVVTAKVVDRFGNPVKGVTVYATKTGAGYFGTGVSTASGATLANGTVDFNIAGGDATVTVSTLDPTAAAGTNAFGQTCALAGNLTCASGATAAVAFTAAVAGTTLVAESGVGASLAPAGVSSASVSVVDATSSTAAAAADAAAEATDAANAATDAANAAAEAADAATAAAQDAADAVAALSAQVATLISGLKAQLTALTNLVIKIQKKVKA